MKRLSILMYHGLYATEAQRLAIDPIDRPYALSTETFARQLDLLAAAHIPVVHPHALEQPGEPIPGGVLLTFDDGHASNAELALPLLKQRGLSALFFVTTDFIGQRTGFCTWDQIRQLTQQGMVVGGHGHTHRFLSDLASNNVLAELKNCKDSLETQLQCEIRHMSFPGGRYNLEAINLAKNLGYDYLYSSDFESLEIDNIEKYQILPRMAIRSNINDPLFLKYAKAKKTTILKESLVCNTKKSIKSIIGNGIYNNIYDLLKK
jgi:peptidoglycan/xylan/chitin deacetylase (PgdA/CDA1 family)